MKTTTTITTHACDCCGYEDRFMDSCMSCKKDLCVRCWRLPGNAIYPHSITFSGSGDGYYCSDCDAKLTSDGTDKKHNLYREIAWLKKEAREFNISLGKRARIAEKALEGMK